MGGKLSRQRGGGSIGVEPQKKKTVERHPGAGPG